jgi:hypothetical protein
MTGRLPFKKNSKKINKIRVRGLLKARMLKPFS